MGKVAFGTILNEPSLERMGDEAVGWGWWGWWWWLLPFLLAPSFSFNSAYEGVAYCD
jgi:hypothetical protein